MDPTKGSTGRKLRMLVGISVAAMLSVPPATAQSGQGVPPAEAAAVPAGPPATPGRLTPGTTILSDTQGVDFAPYMKRLHFDLQRNWDPLIPEEVKPPQNKKGVVSIRFTILPDGTIGSMKLETRSDDVGLDKAAWFAIASEGKFPALPSAFHGSLLDLRVVFAYNSPAAP